MDYSLDSLVRLAKRDNNAKRPYLYVNPKQGKHIPADPKEIASMCHALADRFIAKHEGENLFVIGFAETATGIASLFSSFLNGVKYYQNTTRERKEGMPYLYWTESHSHATDQMLWSEGIAKHIREVDRIVFFDDEVTTGNTILKLIRVLQDEYQLDHVGFTIVSILNSMQEERKAELAQMGIDCVFLSTLPYEYKIDTILGIEGDPSRMIDCKNLRKRCNSSFDFMSNCNPRSFLVISKYMSEMDRFVQEALLSLGELKHKNVLVLGTEECMFPAISLAYAIEDHHEGAMAKMHATTRSPILPSSQEGYPLHTRYELRSFYDTSRTTYIYNLASYDEVVIVTDAAKGEEGFDDLCYALEKAGNPRISCFRLIYE